MPFSTVSFCFSKVTVWSFVALTVTATCAVAVPQLSVTVAVPVFTAVSVTEQLPVEASTEAGTVTTLSSDDRTASTSPLAAPVSVTDREAVAKLSTSISTEVSAVIALTPDCTVIVTLPSVCVSPPSVTVAVMVAEPTFCAVIVMPLMLTISAGLLVSITFDTSAPFASLTLTVVDLLTFSVVFSAVTETIPSTAKTAGTMAMTSVSTTNRLRSFANVRFIPVHLFLRRASPLLL